MAGIQVMDSMRAFRYAIRCVKAIAYPRACFPCGNIPPAISPYLRQGCMAGYPYQAPMGLRCLAFYIGRESSISILLPLQSGGVEKDRSAPHSQSSIGFFQTVSFQAGNLTKCHFGFFRLESRNRARKADEMAVFGRSEDEDICLTRCGGSTRR